MATSGSKYINVADTTSGSYTQGVRLLVEWEERSQSVANNRTTIRITLRIVTGTYGAMYGSAPQTWKISCSGESESGSFTIQQGNNTTRTLGHLDVTIPHNNDGTKSFTASVSASFNMDFNGWVGTVKGSITGTLDTIPRASTPSVSGVLQLGNEITIKTNRASTKFTHTLKWEWAGKSGTIDTDVGASTTWTPAIATFAPYLTDATSDTCTIVCDTYSGATKIGTKEKTFKLAIPGSVMPSMSSAVVDDAEGLLDMYGAYILNKSSVVVQITAAGIYGSTIKKYEGTMDGVTATGNPVALGVPTQTGERSITVKVTDTRGRAVSATRKINVVDYFAPAFASLVAFRADPETMEEEDESTTVYAYFDANFCNVNGSNVNILSSQVKYRQSNTESWTTVQQWSDTALGSGASMSVSHGITIPNCSESNRYEILFSMTDLLGSTTETILEVGTAQPVMDLKSDGEGAAFFAIADKIGVKIGKPVWLTKESGIVLENSSGAWLNALMPTAEGRPRFENHAVLKNNSFLLGELLNGNQSRILGINAEDELELTWTKGGMRGRPFKQIWTGSLEIDSSATINVPELPYYNVLLIYFSNRGAVQIAVRSNISSPDNTYFYGYGAYTDGTSFTKYAMRFQVANGTQVKNLESMAHVGNGTVQSSGTLSGIRGLF